MNKLILKIKSIGLFFFRTYRKRRVKPIRMRDKQLQVLNKEYNNQRFYGPQKYFCYAPFGSLFISYSGKVSPCYACNINESMEHKSILEIWNGDAFQSLRNDISRGIIPEACSFCSNHFESEDYGSILANKYDHYLMSATGLPVIAELELSNQCNLECVMCTGSLSSAIRKNRENLPAVISKLPENFVEQFQPILKHLKSLELTGGDPFLINIYFDILHLAETINPKIDVLITTNANTFNTNTELLLQKKLKLSFNVSIDSLVESTYSEIRRNGSLKTALKNIEIFSRYTQEHNTSLGFLICPLKENWKELPNFVEFANKRGATLSYHVVFKPAEHALWSLSSVELEKISNYLKSFHFKGYNFTSNINIKSYDSLVHLIDSWYNKAILREENMVVLLSKMELDINSARTILVDKINDADLFAKIEESISKTEIKEYLGLIYIALSKKNKEELVEGLSLYTQSELNEKLKLYYNEVYSLYFYSLKYSDNDKYKNNTL